MISLSCSNIPISFKSKAFNQVSGRKYLCPDTSLSYKVRLSSSASHISYCCCNNFSLPVYHEMVLYYISNSSSLILISTHVKHLTSYILHWISCQICLYITRYCFHYYISYQVSNFCPFMLDLVLVFVYSLPELFLPSYLLLYFTLHLTVDFLFPTRYYFLYYILHCISSWDLLLASGQICLFGTSWFLSIYFTPDFMIGFVCLG